MHLDGRIVVVIEAVHAERDELAEGLRRRGFVAIPVADPASATVVLRSVRPDLVLWHGADPDDAAQVAVAAWRGWCPSARIVAVVTTTVARTDTLRRGGADAVLPAPIEREYLEELVVSFLDDRIGSARRGGLEPS